MTSLAWQVEALRFTFIGLEDEFVEKFSHLQALSISPETVTSKPQTMAKTEEAPWHQGRLSLISQPRRLDIIYHAAPPENLGLPKGGDSASVGRELLSLLSPLEKSVAGRVACGGVFLHEVSDAKKGYLALSKLLPFVSFSDDMREFGLQINRPKQNGAITYNELSKWSIITLRFMQLDNLGNAFQGANSESAVRFEFDFNTAEMTPLHEGENLLAHLNHLFERCIEVSQGGAQ